MTVLDPKWIRVSSILSMIPTQDAEGKWGYPMYNINQEVLQRKATLGTSVHAAIAAHWGDDFYVVNEKEQGYFDSYLKWEKSVTIQCAKVEGRLYHEAMRLTGCIDMIATIGSSDKRYLIDFKCTASPDPVKWPIQAALYLVLAQTNGIEVEKTCLFVQLDQNGELPKVHKFEITREIISAAISFYNAYTYLKGMRV